MGLFYIWRISVWYGAREEGVCWNCFSPLRRGSPMEVTPQQRQWQGDPGNIGLVFFHSSVFCVLPSILLHTWT